METIKQTTQLSKRITRMAESATIKMAQLARDLKAQGHPVISLSLGEPDFDTPQHIKDAAVKALADGYTKYTPVPGLIELREAICTKLKRDNGLEYSPNQIVVSNGAKQCIANLSLALLDEGDEVIIFTPYWVSYREIMRLGGGNPVHVNAGIDQDFKVSARQLAEAITPKTRMLIFSSPCNPTGSSFTPEELAELVAVLEEHPQIIVVSDEIYEYINFTSQGHVSIASFDSIKDRTVVVNGFSKGFAMTGWRLGYLAAPEWIAKACTKMQGQFTSGANAFGQMAAAYALTSNMKPTQDMKVAYQRRRDLLIDALSKIDGFKVNTPPGAFYLFPDIHAFFGKADVDGNVIENADDFCEYILHHAHVAIVTGTAFGEPNCVRFSYAASDEILKEAASRIAKAVAKLK
ncbi:MAG: pyridoxal phosphate-dependent aminotransferase [Saprospiraceae bacterium]|nr:pyridoxal phosphate-dependent aminotransferase [Saprospiraceae bacterium]